MIVLLTRVFKYVLVSAKILLFYVLNLLTSNITGTFSSDGLCILNRR